MEERTGLDTDRLAQAIPGHVGSWGITWVRGVLRRLLEVIVR